MQAEKKYEYHERKWSGQISTCDCLSFVEEKGDTVHLDTQSVDQTRDPNSQVNTNPV